MSAVVAYTRVSTDDQTCENQRRTISARYSVGKWFSDDGVSGTVAATQRAGLGALLAYVREGDVVVVAAIDRLGRNTLDVLNTVEALKARCCRSRLAFRERLQHQGNGRTLRNIAGQRETCLREAVVPKTGEKAVPATSSNEALATMEAEGIALYS